MAGATSKLQILIEAKNNSSGAIKSVETDLRGLDKTAKSISGGLGGLAAAAGAAGIAALGTAAATAAIDMAKGAAQTERLATAFDTLASQAGQSADAMLAAMQEASQGTISNADLMLNANTAMMLGVADSADEMSQLLEVASARGKAFGVSTAEAFGAITQGLGRLSPEILNNIGIVINAQKTYAAYASEIGKTADQLTEQEKMQALVNATIKSSTDLVEANKKAGGDAASNYERMDAALTNAKDALGQLFSPAVAAIAQSIADATVKATEGAKAMAEEQGKINQGWDLGATRDEIQKLTVDIAMAEIALQTFKDEGKETSDSFSRVSYELAGYREQLAAAQKKQAELTGALFTTIDPLEQLDQHLQEVAGSLKEVGPAAAQAGMGLDAMGKRLPWLTEQLANLKAQSDATSSALAGIASGAIGAVHSAASAAVGLIPSTKIAEIYDKTTKNINEQIKVMSDLNMTTSEIDFRTQEYAKKASLPFDLAVEAARAAEKQNTATAASVDTVSQAYSDLESAVSGVLSGALDPGVGVNPDDLLPRADAVNEDARRLADVAVNGWASPWAEYFRKEFPDQFQEMAASNDIKTGAAIMLRNFQDGLEPELINKDVAKERVRKMLIGDANMAQLATEIATELSQEMGIPMQEALSAAQGTLGGGKGMGSEAATTFSEDALAAMQDEDGGGSFVSTFVDQARAKYSLLATAGTDAARTWGDAFLAKVGDSVPPALVNLLTDLVTPEVVARMAQRGSLTGAVP